MSLLPKKCKCPFDHHEISNPNPPAQGSETYPDYHSFDDAVEPEKFELLPEDLYAIELFKNLVRIPSVTGDCPNGPAEACIKFLGDYCDRWGIEWRSMEFVDKYPIFLATIPGQDPSLPAICLNSHFDVVPVIRSKWIHPPFDAIELDNGDIVGRGTQDMKCVVIQHFIGIVQAMRQLATAQGVNCTLEGDEEKPKLGQMKLLKRTVYLSVVPDEEMGGPYGTLPWVNATVPDQEKGLVPARDMNIGFMLDEGLASTERNIVAFYGERSVWWLKLVAKGPTGHGSRFIEGTAMEKLMCAVNQMLFFRDAEYKRLHGLNPAETQDIGCEHAKALKLGDVTTLNLTMLEGGVKAGDEYSYNVIPTTAQAGFDIRIPPTVDIVEFEEKMRAMLPEGVDIHFYVKTTTNNISPTSDRYFNTLTESVKSFGMDLKTELFPSATDGRHHRNVLNTPVIGFSPLFNQPMMLHDHDERLNKWIFARGVHIMTKVVKDLTLLD